MSTALLIKSRSGLSEEPTSGEHDDRPVLSPTLSAVYCGWEFSLPDCKTVCVKDPEGHIDFFRIDHSNGQLFNELRSSIGYIHVLPDDRVRILDPESLIGVVKNLHLKKRQ